MAFEPRSFEKRLQEAVQAHVATIAEDEIKKAQANIERRVREDVGSIAAGIFMHFDYERQGERLIITVDFRNTKA